MKPLKYTVFILCLIFSFVSFSQNTTGINTASPSIRAALDVHTDGASKQGFLVPRLATADTSTIKAAGIPLHSKGLMFYDTTRSAYWYWNGTKWLGLGGTSSSSGNFWNLNGNTLVGGDTGTTAFKYIGTNTDFPLIFATNGQQQMRISKYGNVGIGMTPTDGIPLSIKNNGTGLILQMESSNTQSPLFEFRQTPNNHARLVLRNIEAPSREIQLSAGSDFFTYFNAGDVGIGTASPIATLDVSGTIRSKALDDGLYSIVLADAQGILYKAPAPSSKTEIFTGNLSWDIPASGYWTRNATKNYMYMTTPTDLVGIGISGDPKAKLEVADASLTNLLALSGGNGALRFQIESSTNTLRSLSWDGTTGRNILLSASALATGLTVMTDGNVLVSGLAGSGSSLIQTDPYGVLSRYTGSALSGAGVVNRVAFWTGANTLGNSNNLQWDNTNAYLGVGLSSSAAAYRIHVQDNSGNPGIFCRQDGLGPAIQGNNYDNGAGVLGGSSGTGYGVHARMTGTGIALYADGGTTGFSGVFMGGNVGIGTATPTSKLEVVGSVEIPAANDYTYSTAKSHVMSINGSAFGVAATVGSGSQIVMANTAYGYGVTLSGGTNGTVRRLMAPVNLPDGATVTNMEVVLLNNSGYTQTVALYRIDDTPNNTPLASISIASAPGARVFTDASIANPLVDNSTYSYYLFYQAHEGVTASNMALYTVRITYTVTKAD